jgi:hypothetical protein
MYKLFKILIINKMVISLPKQVWLILLLPIVLAGCFSTFLVSTEFYFKEGTFKNDQEFVTKVKGSLDDLSLRCHAPSFEGDFLDCISKGWRGSFFLGKHSGLYVVEVQTSTSGNCFSPCIPNLHFEIATKLQDRLSEFPIKRIERRVDGITTIIQDAGKPQQ